MFSRHDIDIDKFSKKKCENVAKIAINCEKIRNCKKKNAKIAKNCEIAKNCKNTLSIPPALQKGQH